MQRGNKTAKLNFINSGAVDIIRSAYYIHGPESMKLILPFYMCHTRWALHVIIQEAPLSRRAQRVRRA